MEFDFKNLIQPLQYSFQLVELACLAGHMRVDRGGTEREAVE